MMMMMMVMMIMMMMMMLNIMMMMIMYLLQGQLPLGSSRRRRESGEVLRGSPACKRDSLAPTENVRMYKNR